MRSIIHIPIVLFLVSFLISQDDPLEESKSVQGAFGAVTIDGKIWNQIALRPILPFGKLAISFDIVLYIDQDGNIHDDEWDFSSGQKIKNTILDKIYYIRYGRRQDPYYFRAGALDYVSMGYGILANGYSNSILYPQVRKVGMEARLRAFDLDIYGFTNDFTAAAYHNVFAFWVVSCTHEELLNSCWSAWNKQRISFYKAPHVHTMQSIYVFLRV